MATSSARKASSSKSAAVASPEVSKSSEKKGRTSSAKSAKAEKAATTQHYQRFSKDTAGTFRFEAVDPKTGKPLAQDDKQAHVTQLYVRKSSSAMSSDPRYLIVTIQEVDKLPKGATVSSEEDE